MNPTGLSVLSQLALDASIALAGASLVSCGPPIERTPPAPGRNDAMVVKADAPVWKPGDVWRYRGRTFDSRDNRFYQRVVSATQEGGRTLYEVDTPRYVEFFDARTLRLVRHRHKETGQVTGAMTLNPLFFPLNFATSFNASGTRTPEGEAPRPYQETCHVVNYEDVTVHAGTFAAFRIDCETADGFAEHWYAPDVHNLVKLRWMATRESFSAELWDYELAP